jgi:transposase InsO family protein
MATFNTRFRDEPLDGEIFYSLKEAQVVIEEWRRHDNTIRPRSSLGYRPPKRSFSQAGHALAVTWTNRWGLIRQRAGPAFRD